MMQMRPKSSGLAKGLAIPALIVAILAIFIPLISIYFVWIALVFATFAGYFGEKPLTIAATVISFVNVFFMSPLTLLVFFGEGLGGGAFFLTTTILLLVAPVVTVILAHVRSRKTTMVPGAPMQ